MRANDAPEQWAKVLTESCKPPSEICRIPEAELFYQPIRQLNDVGKIYKAWLWWANKNRRMRIKEIDVVNEAMGKVVIWRV